jgi:hypothetical protein
VVVVVLLLVALLLNTQIVLPMRARVRGFVVVLSSVGARVYFFNFVR